MRNLLCTFLLLAAAANAQLTRGFISGTVSDASSAVIDAVKVTIVNKDTGIPREMLTNSLGVYRFPAVEPGTYSVRFEKQGFETRQVENLAVGTAQEVVLNQTLGIAAATTTIEVSDAAPGVALSKASATLERKMDQSFIANVPLTGNTRDVNTIALVAPTTARGPGSTEISANGQRARNNNFMLDGVDNNDLSVTLSSNRLIPEGVAEYQVQTSSYSAEFGRNSGAQLSAISRGGTNQFHGDVFDYYRANWMEPVSLLNKRANVFRTPRFVQNQAGGDIGGPIIRNRSFFFYLIEANRRREAPDARNATSVTIPTAAGYAALASVPLAPGQTTQSRQAMLSSLGFLTGIHPLINLENVRNVAINGVNIPVGTGRIPLANPHNFWYHQARVDHKLTSAGMLTYRLQVDKREQPDVVSNLGFGNRFSGAQAIMRQNHMLSETHTISPRFVNEFKFGYKRGVLNFPENDPVSPTITISNNFTIGGAANFPQGRVDNTFQFIDVASFLAGRHSLKFGFDIRRNRLFNNAAFDSKGTWVFNSLPDFLNSNAFSVTQAVNASSFDARQTNQFYFVQDDIRVTRDLTINLGLRYEYSDAPFGFFGATLPEVRAARVPGPVRPDKNNWAPRAGLAYSPSLKDGLLGKLLGDGVTVFRGGYGIAYDVLFYNILTVNASNYPRVLVDQQFNLVNVFPQRPATQATLPPFGAAQALATFVNAPEDLQNPTTHFYSFTVQREFLRSNIIEIGYSGNRSYHGIRQGNLNPGILTPAQAATVRSTGNPNSIPTVQQRRLFPQFGSRVTIESSAIANYNAMFVRYDRRLTRGLLVGANYTWSANFSDNDESLGVADITNSTSQVPQDFFNYRKDYARSAFDRPNRFVVHYRYQLPWLKSGWAASPAMRKIFDGWEITGFSEWQSGQPFTLRTGVDSGGTGTTGPFRPDYNPGGAIRMDPVEGNFRTFTMPLDGTGIGVTQLTANGVPLANSMVGGGTLGKSVFRGPAFSNWNFSLAKVVSITERLRLSLRADWINMWNHRNFRTPSPFMNSPAFGTNTSDPGGRTMLVSAKISF